MKEPFLSVIMPVFNVANFLPKAIDSILGQTFQNFEFFIDTTGCTDDSSDIADNYAKQDKRIKHEKNGSDRFISSKLNRMIQLTKGDYIARMDADDISLPERFAKQLAYFADHPDLSVLGTNMVRIDEEGNVRQGFRCMISHEEIVENTANGVAGIANPTVMTRAADLKKMGPYRTQLVNAEDLDMWMRFIRGGYRFANLPEVLLHYRRHDTQITRERWRDMTLITALLKLNHREVMEGKSDILENLQMADINIELIKKFSRDPAEIINNYSGVLFGLLSESAHKKNNDLLQEVAFVIEGMMNNCYNDEVRKQIIPFFAKLQGEAVPLSPNFHDLFYQVYMGFAPLSRQMSDTEKQKILQIMANVGMQQQAANLQQAWNS